MNRLYSMQMEFVKKDMDILMLGQKYVLGSSYYLKTQNILKIAQVLHSKLTRKELNEVIVRIMSSIYNEKLKQYKHGSR